MCCNGSCAVVTVSEPGVVSHSDTEVDGAWFGWAGADECPAVAAAELLAVAIAATTPVAAHNAWIRERFNMRRSFGRCCQVGWPRGFVG